MTAPQIILIVEDDPNTANLVTLYLEREGFKVFSADNGERGLRMARQHHPHLVILDLMLPKVDGWEVCRQLRQHSQVPVIMLTARDEEIDRVAGLTLGADDYVVKPFSPRELVARVKAVLRRTHLTSLSGGRVLNAPQQRIYAHQGIYLDLEKHSVTLKDRPVDLTPHEFSLLEALMTSPGRAFTRDELLDRLYPRGEAVVIDRVVDVHIGKLRQKLESDPAHPRYILTVRGLGYRFAESGADSDGDRL
jgi:DNA-binding response OmpR family regulator